MITPNYPDVRDIDVFAVMQTCRLLGICRTSLGSYEKKGLIAPKYRDGRKVYTGRDIKDFYAKLTNY